MTAQETLLRLAFLRGIEAVSAERTLDMHLPDQVAGTMIMIAAGKAAGAMAAVAAEHLTFARGLVVCPPGHAPERPLPSGIAVIEAGHPVPNEQSVFAADLALRLVMDLTSRDHVIALISGGGSALLSAPATGIGLAEKQYLTRQLLRSGAKIAEMNCIRQCLSRIKGGRLAAAAGNARVSTFAISDIPGDDITLIASGPTVQSRATLAQASAILDRFKIARSPTIERVLTDPPILTTKGVARIIARPMDALAASAQVLRDAGYETSILGDAVEGPAVALAASDAAMALALAKLGGRHALVIGGEANVRLPPDAPPGGRNQAYVLALALALDGAPGIYALACDSDGIDGTTAAAGAIIGPSTMSRIAEAGRDAAAALAGHCAHAALAAAGTLVETGPTRTNVNDIRIILIDCPC